MTAYDDIEKEMDEIRKGNETILVDFNQWIRSKGLSEATANRHRENIDFYINEFLLYEEPQYPEQGVTRVGLFLGYWFIRKAMWASETSIKSNVASLKKFYDFLQERGMVEEEEVEFMMRDIKDRLPEWIATVKRYDDLSVDGEDVWPW